MDRAIYLQVAPVRGSDEFKPDPGSWYNLAIKEGNTKPTLVEAQDFVNGLIEIVHVYFNRARAQMIVNEEGLIRGLPYNVIASSVYHCASIALRGELPTNPVVGNAIILTGKFKLD